MTKDIGKAGRPKREKAIGMHAFLGSHPTSAAFGRTLGKCKVNFQKMMSSRYICSKQMPIVSVIFIVVFGKIALE